MRCMLFALFVFALGYPSSEAGLPALLSGLTLSVPGVDATALQARDVDKDEEPGPLQFAEPFEVEAAPLKSGQWDVPGDGSAVWRLRVSAPGATDLNFGFTGVHLPEGAALRVASASGDVVQGPYTSVHNNPQGRLWTAMVPGDEAILELTVPEELVHEVSLNLASVNRGYRNFFERSLAKQTSCNVDVVCPEGDDWRDEIRSVGVYTLEGFWTCSGSMVMNHRADFTPYFLTANHCGITSNNAASVVVYWNFESPVCGDLDGGSLEQNQSGASLRSRSAGPDSCLIELAQRPVPAFNVYYAGWDATGNGADTAVGIHHPNADEKALCYSDREVKSTVYLSPFVNPAAGHWKVGGWDLGRTEPGSSGSGLWDPVTRRIIGQLHGGLSACGNMRPDWYGKVSFAWDVDGAEGSSLKGWLDPDDTGVLFQNGADATFPLWEGAYEEGNGWKLVDWFGWFYDAGTGWLYHSEHQWLYAAPWQMPASIWFTDPAPNMGAVWTSETFYPWFYRADPATWLYYAPGTTNPRWFWNVAAGEWQNL